MKQSSSSIGQVTRRAFAAATLLAVGAGSSAFALSWASAANPLTVTGYGSTGKGFGTWTISAGADGERYRTSANLWYANADDHKVYAATDNYSNGAYYNSSETTHVALPGAWTFRASSSLVDPNGAFHRATLRVQIDVPWRSDPSSAGWATGNINW